ncbi:hypothetical protein RUND412_004072 [Rhizina undulata]
MLSSGTHTHSSIFIAISLNSTSLTLIMMPVKLCCISRPGRSSSSRAPPPLVQPPPALTPAPDEIPRLPAINFDGNTSSIAVTPVGTSRTPRRPSSIAPTTATKSNPVLAPVQEKSEEPPPQVGIRRRSTFTSPLFLSNNMAPIRTSLSAWQAAAAKVVAVNRFIGVASQDPDVEEFVIEELGGKMGRLVFGPVSVFNGNVSLRIKKPLENMTLSVTFTGVTELGKSLETFLNVSQELYTGNLQAGIRTFLFGFKFPHINLPPTSTNPLIAYAFTAKLTPISPASPTLEAGGSTSPRSKAKTLEYKSRPLEIVFVPYIDPALDTPKLSRTATEKTEKGKGKLKEPEPPLKSQKSSDSTSSGSVPPKLKKPKLTLTTADLPTTASSNGTPVIDRPHPSMIFSAASKTTRFKDEQDRVVARLNVDLPKTRFLPGDDIIIRFCLAVREGAVMPKGFGIRVLEKRALGLEEADRAGSDGERESSDDDEERPANITIIGKERFKVLTGKKFLLHPTDATEINQSNASDPNRNYQSNENGDVTTNTNAEKEDDSDLLGGKEIEIPIRVRLPTFQAFVTDSLLPTATLALSSSTVGESPFTTHGTATPPTATSTKRKEPVRSTPTASPASANSSISILPPSLGGVNFVVSHVLQVTVPMSASNTWFRMPNHCEDDLEIAIPLILGNRNPAAIYSKKKLPELRVNAHEVNRFWSLEGSSRSSGRSNSRSGSLAEKSGWSEGDRFLTLKETEIRPSFVVDSH